MDAHEDLPWPADPVVPPDYSRPSARYRRLVVLSALVFVGFLLAWGGLTGWLGFLVYRAVRGLLDGTGTAADVGMALPAGFLCLVLLRGLLQVHRAPTHEGRVEISAVDEPVLLAFIHQIADRVRAPRPRRVFLEPHVNAAVVQDVHLASLVWPRGRDLVIGLGLVNVLSLDEFKAVVAHELGHFSQRAMGMGRWVYTAQVFVRELVYARGRLDHFLHALSRIDLRVAWIGWLMRLVVWSVRAIFEQAWRWVTRLQLALTREMEHHADLVAASVAGCDSPVHALHKAMAGDQAYGAAVRLAEARYQRAHLRVEDLYALQDAQLELRRDITGDGEWGRRPAGAGEASFRVFPLPLAQQPEMWATHPPNHDREAVIKSKYVASTLDDRSAWCLFADPTARRLELTRHALPGISNNLDPEPTAASLQTLDAIRARPRFQRRYRGLYLKRGLTRMRRVSSDLVGTIGAGERDAVLARIDALYPAALEDRLARFETLSQERGMLQAIHEGWARPPGGIVVFRGERLPSRAVEPRLEALEAEWRAALDAVFEDFREARAAHLAAARLVGGGWRDHLEGLLAVLHYCEHLRARVEEAVEVFQHELHIALADGNVSASELRRLCGVGEDLQREVALAWEQRRDVQPGAGILDRFGHSGWAELFGEHPPLAPPTPADFGVGWHESALQTAHTLMSALHDLASCATDELLSVEDRVAAALRSEAPLGRAPAPPSLPAQPPQKAFDDDALHLRKLPLWERFIHADGPAPAVARFSAAAAVLAPALLLTGAGGTSELVVFNGLGGPIWVQIDDLEAVVAAGETYRTPIETGPHRLVATDPAEQEVEALEVDLAHRGAQVLWNIDSAGILVEWTAAYGASRPRAEQLGVPASWSVVDVDHLFEVPPAQVTLSRSGGALRTVLEAAPQRPFVVDLEVLGPDDRARVIAAHVAHDPLDSRDYGGWFERLSVEDRAAAYLARGGASEPRLVRLMADVPGSVAACADLDIDAALAESAGAAYRAAGCADTAEVAERAAAQWPDDPLIAYTAALWAAQRGSFETACGSLLDHREALVWEETPLASGTLGICRLAGRSEVELARLLPDDHPLAGVMRSLRQQPAPGDPLLDRAVYALHTGSWADAEAVAADVPDPRLQRSLRLTQAVTRWVEEGDRRPLAAFARQLDRSAVTECPECGLAFLAAQRAAEVDPTALQAHVLDLGPTEPADLQALAALQAGDRAAFDTRAAQVSFGAQVQLALAASTLLGPDTPPDQRRLAALALHPAVAPAIAP